MTNQKKYTVAAQQKYYEKINKIYTMTEVGNRWSARQLR